MRSRAEPPCSFLCVHGILWKRGVLRVVECSGSDGDVGFYLGASGEPVEAWSRSEFSGPKIEIFPKKFFHLKWRVELLGVSENMFWAMGRVPEASGSKWSSGPKKVKNFLLRF